MRVLPSNYAHYLLQHSSTTAGAAAVQLTPLKITLQFSALVLTLTKPHCLQKEQTYFYALYLIFMASKGPVHSLPLLHLCRHPVDKNHKQDWRQEAIQVESYTERDHFDFVPTLWKQLSLWSYSKCIIIT